MSRTKKITLKKRKRTRFWPAVMMFLDSVKKKQMSV